MVPGRNKNRLKTNFSLSSGEKYANFLLIFFMNQSYDFFYFFIFIFLQLNEKKACLFFKGKESLLISHQKGHFQSTKIEEKYRGYKG